MTYVIIFYIGDILISSLFSIQTQAQQTRTDQSAINSKIQDEDDPHFFPCAFAHGTFEILERKGWINGLSVRNVNPDNLTIDVRAYYAQEQRWIYRQGSSIICGRYIGFIGSHNICVFGFGGVQAFP